MRRKLPVTYVPSRRGTPARVAAASILTLGFVAATAPAGEVSIRAGRAGTIVSVERNRVAAERTARVIAGVDYPFPRPRLSGFSPLLAVTTSNARRSEFEDDPYSHDVQSTYVGSALHAPANQNIVIGFLDSGAAVDLVAGSAAAVLGLTGSRLTDNTMELGGVSGNFTALVSQPVGIFAAGFGSMDHNGLLKLTEAVGHSNVSIAVSPPIDCGSGEAVGALLGMPFVTFFNSVIRVDTPRRAVINGVEYLSPDVQIQPVFEPVPEYPNAFAMEFGALLPALGAAFMQDFDDPLDVVPGLATSLSLIPGSFPSGGAFFVNVQVLQGEPGPFNPVQTLRMMIDTGAQSSILSGAAAANLSLPVDPDFTVEVCGVGGVEPGISGYYIDYVAIAALGGPLRWSRAPFVIIDLPSPEGGILDGILGMNFFWDRNVTFEPSLEVSSFFQVSDPVPFAYADFDLDLDVDVQDERFFSLCMTDPSPLQSSPECDHVDADFDGDVDLQDFTRVQNCMSGGSVPAGDNCGR